MLRLFLDCLDISEASDDGWTIVGGLVRSFNKEDTSLASNSITWLLQKYCDDGFVTLGRRTIWHGINHGVRAFLDLIQVDMVKQKLLSLGYFGEKTFIDHSHLVSISQWVALQVASRKLLPMQIMAASFLHIDGYSWIAGGEEPDPLFLEKSIPYLFNEWTNTLRDSIERVEELTVRELEETVCKANWNSGQQRPHAEELTSDEQLSDGKFCCSECGDDYTTLAAGLVEPRWIAFAECVKSYHQFNCTCFEPVRDHYSQSIKLPSNEALGPQNCPGSRDPQSDQTLDDEDWILERLEDDNKDPFKGVAHFLYCVQGRRWFGSHKLGELLCGSCFFKREGYLNEDGKSDWETYGTVPPMYQS
jgi:hypothetical protein